MMDILRKRARDMPVGATSLAKAFANGKTRGTPAPAA
jgi:hypothetical protein